MAFEETNNYNHLEELNGSDYQIVEGEPDITGWRVIDGQGREIGEVDDVLFDPQTRAVRYIIVDLENNDLEIENRKVLVPIGIAELWEEEEDEDDAVETDTLEDEDGEPVERENTVLLADEDIENFEDVEEFEEVEDEIVYLPTVTIDHLLALPTYQKGAVSPEIETEIRNVFESPAENTVTLYEKDNFYHHEHFNNKIYPRDDQSNFDQSGETPSNRDGENRNIF
jgi:ribosomal 30S subunit maturation factor RimM